MSVPLLSLSDLHVTVADRAVVRGVTLTVQPGEVHAIMGPNGSGKSSLVNALAGHPAYGITGGTARLGDADLVTMEAHERARAGLFLAFQYPREIAGVTLRNFLVTAVNMQREARDEKRLSPIQFSSMLATEMTALQMDPSFAERSLNKGFSGGEKKKAEILQLVLLQPRLALLDETDSGLDVDALKIVAEGVQRQRARDPQFAAVIVTHYARILAHLQPDHVHVMVDGRIVKSGGSALAQQLEQEGYADYRSDDGRIALS